MKLAEENKARIIPIDSEHSAIAQILIGKNSSEIEKLILTASGGSLFEKTKEELKTVTVAEALRHPNWQMGAKITVDSATLMNKGFEIMEAAHLFKVPKKNCGGNSSGKHCAFSGGICRRVGYRPNGGARYAPADKFCFELSFA